VIVYAIYNNNPPAPGVPNVAFVVRRWVISARAKTTLSQVPLAPFPGRVDPYLEAEWGGTYPLAKSAKAVQPTLEVEIAFMAAGSLKLARSLLPKGVKRIAKEEGDDPSLVELWV
jgi:hypothetical protein